MNDLGFLVLMVATAASMVWLTRVYIKRQNEFWISYMSVIAFLMSLTMLVTVFS